jgi:hypothetical protein
VGPLLGPHEKELGRMRPRFRGWVAIQPGETSRMLPLHVCDKGVKRRTSLFANLSTPSREGSPPFGSGLRVRLCGPIRAATWRRVGGGFATQPCQVRPMTVSATEIARERAHPSRVRRLFDGAKREGVIVGGGQSSGLPRQNRRQPRHRLATLWKEAHSRVRCSTVDIYGFDEYNPPSTRESATVDLPILADFVEPSTSPSIGPRLRKSLVI